MTTNSKNTWFSAPTTKNLVIAWTLGIGGCDILAWLGFRYDGPFRLAAGLWMLVTGITVWRKWYPGKIDVFSSTRWWLGLIIILVILLHPIFGGLPSIQFEWWNHSALIYFFWCVIVIGFAEELWWRGIWFEIWKGKPVICVLAGSLAFTAYHFPFQGWEVMIGSGLIINVFFMGLLFAAARYRGTSIGVLALAHGLIDWFQGGIQWKQQTGHIPFVICCLVITTILLGAKGKDQTQAYSQGALQ